MSSGKVREVGEGERGGGRGGGGGAGGGRGGRGGGGGGGGLCVQTHPAHFNGGGGEARM